MGRSKRTEKLNTYFSTHTSHLHRSPRRRLECVSGTQKMLARDEFFDVDVARAERACPANTDDHSSRGFARHLVSDAQEPHQSIQAIMLARVRRGHVGLHQVDVGGDRIRRRHDLENPSTTVDAESRELQRHHRLREASAKRASVRCSFTLSSQRPPGPFRVSGRAECRAPCGSPARPRTARVRTPCFV